MDSKNKKIIIVLSVVAVALLLLNFLIVTNHLQRPTCVKDVCFYGEGSSNPYSFMKNSTNQPMLILKNTAPEEKTQTGSYITKAMVELASAYPGKNYTFVSIGLDENNTPVTCHCEKQFITGSKNVTSENCSYTLQQCIDLKPESNEFMIELKYPDYSKNKVFFNSANSVEVQAKTGVDLYAISVLLKAMTQ